MISFQTLLKASGYYQHRYYDLLLLIRKYSQDPQVDSERLFRQMVFNALVGNTDDHLKNFMMIHDHQQGWRLSPAFDLIPDIGQRREHVLFFDLDADYPGRQELERLGRLWGISRAGGVVDEVVQSVREWRISFAGAGVSEQDTQRFADIDVRLKQ
jgi:serine/threonine-protein kinase HipA